MKRLFAFLAITLMILISCELQTDDPTSPTDPDTDLESITITAPAHGDTLTIAAAYNIQWTSSNITKLLTIEYTLDNGNSWELIVQDIDDVGGYIWAPIPNKETNEGRVRITTEDSSYTALSTGFFIISRESSKALAVTQPNGGEKWAGNSSQTVTWFSSGVSKVNIEYTVDNGLNWLSVDTGVVSNGFYVWDPLPNTPSTNAKIRVIDADEQTTSDESDNVFAIEPEDAITVESPNGGEEWLSGSSQYIRWSTGFNQGFDPLAGAIIGELGKVNVAGKGKNFNTIKRNTKFGASDLVTSNNSPDEISAIENVKIEYSSNNGANWTIVAASVSNNGIYFWNQIPNVNSSLCIVRISDADDGLPFDVSDNSFAIFDTLPQEIIVTSPNGGEVWEAGTTENVTWNSENVANVKIEYTTDNGVNWNTIVESTTSDGFYTWEKLPNEASTNSRIRISDAADGTPADISDEFFTIAPEPEIKVIAPNGGETLQSGASINILWTSTNIAEVKIEYTMNNGAEWILVADNVSSTGTYSWLDIPDVNSSQVRIKVSDALDNMPFDISDDNLAITNQIVKIIEVVSPNGGELWEASTSKNITWNSTAVTLVKLEYTSNNGLNWIDIEDSVRSSGSYDWNVPNVNSTQAKVRVSDAEGSETSDESNGTFKIKQAGTLKLLKPESGEVWIAGDLNKIEWEAKNIEKVKIEFTTTNAIYDPEAEWFDDAWFDLITNAPGAAGFYEARFTIPSTEYRLRISDAEFNEPVDFSGLFTVKEQPVIDVTVTTPNGGEDWLIGETYEITWTSENVDNVTVVYTINNGASWNSIATNIPSNGIYNWLVPDVANRSDLCKVRIYKALDTTIFDESDGLFSIFPKVLRIISPNGGEAWDVSKENRIEWITSGITNVDLYYTLDNGASDWINIVSNLPSTGAYPWNPPDTASALARILIVDSDDSSVRDESDSYFNLVAAGDRSITVITPNGGESYLADASANIQWMSTNVQNVKIEFSSNNGAEWQTLEENIPSFGNYTWSPVPDNLNSTLCVIKISDADRTEIFDISDETFVITNQIVESISVTSPNGGEDWKAGSLQNITWTASGVSQVDIEYSTNTGLTWKTIITSLESSGAYEWILPDSVNSPQAKIKIKDADDGVPVDESDAVFTISPKPFIAVLAPTGGDVFNAGEEIVIRWESAGIENVGMQYTTTNGLGSLSEPAFYNITGSTPNTGEYATSFSIPSNEYYIEIFDAATSGTRNRSIGNFTISPQITKSITVLTPNGGEALIAGERHEIQWFSNGVENVSIEYSLNGGSTWTMIDPNEPSDGLFDWLVPYNTPESDNCIVRISDVENEAIKDISNGVFSIMPKIEHYVRVVTPNGGELWNFYQGNVIEWTSSPGVEFVNIYYTLNNGATWDVVINDYPSYGAYEWNPPDVVSSLARIRIDATKDINDSTITGVSDVSDGTFSLIEDTEPPDPFIVILAPEKDITWAIGTDQDIRWFLHRDINMIDIEYSTQNGAQGTWVPITMGYTDIPWNDEGSFTWTIPNIPTNVARVRITGYNESGNQVEQVMSEPFNIK